jgi:hypothetical protein
VPLRFLPATATAGQPFGNRCLAPISRASAPPSGSARAHVKTIRGWIGGCVEPDYEVTDDPLPSPSREEAFITGWWSERAFASER